jgi:hypothetical protein
VVKPEQLKDLLHTAQLPRRDALLLILATKDGQPSTPTQIVNTGRDNGITDISTWNVSQYLGGHKGYFVKLPEGWVLGPKGRQEIVSLVSKLTGGPLVAINQTLRALLPKLPAACASFVGEAIACYEAKCYRASVVLSWVGAVASLHDHVVTNHLGAFNAEALARDANWKLAKIADDLGLMNEGTFLDIMVKISALGKNVKEHLKNHCLALRNACGHPNSVEPGEHMVAAHLESLINHVFTKF